MLPLLRSLFSHQAWADNQMLQAVAAHPNAYDDADLRRVLNHIYVVQRFFNTLLRSEPFDFAAEMAPAETLDALAEKYHDVQARQTAYLDTIDPEVLARVVEVPMLKDVTPTVGVILTQVVFHSQGHRGQALTRLRQLGATPPTLDYILWAGRKMPIDGQ